MCKKRAQARLKMLSIKYVYKSYIDKQDFVLKNLQ